MQCSDARIFASSASSGVPSTTTDEPPPSSGPRIADRSVSNAPDGRTSTRPATGVVAARSAWLSTTEPSIQAGALIMAGTYALANFGADIAYALLDKRIRYD